MTTITTIADLPSKPAVYAMYGGRGRSLHVEYVGITEKLKQQVNQHLVRRDSSITTGVSIVSLNRSLVTEVHWWEHPAFHDRAALEAAELVGFELLDPALRSRGYVTDRAKELARNGDFRLQMQTLFDHEPSGRLVILTMQDALGRIEELERQVADLWRILERQ